MRTTQTFLTDWLFCFDAKTEDTADFVPVTLPHTWNNLDGQDGGNDYKRGVGLYKKNFTVKVYSDADAVSLTFNGNPVKTKTAKYNRQKNVFLFQNIRLQIGENTVTAIGTNGETDTVVWQFGGEK